MAVEEKVRKKEEKRYSQWIGGKQAVQQKLGMVMSYVNLRMVEVMLRWRWKPKVEDH